MRILIVDDSKTFLMHISHMLSEEKDIEIETLQFPDKAIEVALKYKPDLLLTDFEMPKMNGPELCRKFKENDELKSTPIIMLTSKEGDSPLVLAIKSGADDFLCKSSSKEVIRIKIMGALRKSLMTKELLKLKQLEAVRSLIVTANHEFNNVLMISDAYLNKILKEIGEDQSKNIKKVIECNQRMFSVVEKLNTLDIFEEENYIEGVKMLKI